MPEFIRVTIDPAIFNVTVKLARLSKTREALPKIDEYKQNHAQVIARSVLTGKLDYDFIQGFADHLSMWRQIGCLPVGRGKDEEGRSVVWVLAAVDGVANEHARRFFNVRKQGEEGPEVTPGRVGYVRALLEEETLKGHELVFLCAPREIVDMGLEAFYIIGRLEEITEQESKTEEVAVDVVPIDFKDTPDIERAVVERGLGWLRNAINRSATDIHIEPVEGGGRVRVRIDGLLVETDSFVKSSVLRQVITWLKVQGDVDIAEQRRPLDGKMKLVRMVDNQRYEVDVRYSSIPTIYGEKVVLRLLDKSKQADKYLNKGRLRGVFPGDDIGDAGEELYNTFVKAVEYDNGIVLVTGPTGCGKTTTLNSSLRYLIDKNGKTKNIITIEDPVEYTVLGANQIQTNDLADLTFASALRSILRQDPDIVLVGEIRDDETANVAVQAALTGHLILSTLHTNDAIGCVERLMDLGVSPPLIGSTVRLFQAQRLVRLLCPGESPPPGVTSGCAVRLSEEQTMQKVLSSRLAPYAERFQGRYAWDVNRAGGCEWCEGRGYKGRRAVMEVVPMRAALRAAIQSKVPRDELLAVARAECGLRSMAECGIDFVLAGKIDLPQVEELEMGYG